MSNHKNLSLILIIFFISSTSCSEVIQDFGVCNETTLLLTHIVFRHGDRTPEPKTVYPTDPYKNHSYFPYNLGDLIEKGIRRMYNQGISLRNRYGNVLGEYFHDLVYSETDGYQRCQLSLQCVHAGMFPPESNRYLLPRFNWQPIPYEIIPDSKILNPFNEKELRTWKIPPAEDEETQKLFDYVQKHSGFPTMNYQLFTKVEDRTRNEINNGLKIPKWLQTIYPEPMSSTAYHYLLLLMKEHLPKASGALFKKIADDASKKAEGTLLPTQRKLFLYSGHDTNIAAILTALNLYSGEVINYGAQVIFELHQIDGIFGFQIYLSNFNGLVLLDVPDCGIFCPLDKFIANTKWLYEDEPVY